MTLFNMVFVILVLSVGNALFFSQTVRKRVCFSPKLYGTRNGGGRDDRENSRRGGGKDTKAFGTDGIRQARISRYIRDELSEIITTGDIKANNYPPDDLLRSTSVMNVDISSDLTVAKASISVLGNSVQKRQVFVWLCENSGQVRFELAKRLSHMRRVPEIQFRLSETKAASDLVSLIEEIAPKSSAGDEFEFEEV